MSLAEKKMISFEETKKAVFGEISNSLATVTDEAASAFTEQLSPGRRVFCDAAGRSRLQISGFAMRLAQMGYTAFLVGEPTTTAVCPGDVLIVCSASGNTPGIVSHALTAKKIGCRILLVTASPQSELSEICDAKIILDAASKNDQSSLTIQPMGSLFEQSAGLVFDIIVLGLMEKYGIYQKKMREQHSNLE